MMINQTQGLTVPQGFLVMKAVSVSGSPELQSAWKSMQR